MSLKDWLKRIAFLLPLSLGALNPSVAAAQDSMCAGGSCSGGTPACGKACCQWWGCPGPYVHCTPKVPCFKFKKTCGKPLCDACDMEGYGYYPTCWRPWDQPLNYACIVPTPTQLVPPAMVPVPGHESAQPAQPMPRPDLPRR